MSNRIGVRGSRFFLTEEEKQNRPKLSGIFFKRILEFLLPYRSKLFFVVLTIIISSVLGLLPSILTGLIIDEGLIAGDLDRLIRLVVISVAVLFVSNLIGVLESYLNSSVAYSITFDIRNSMYAHLQNMSHRFFATSRQGDIITRMTSDIDGVEGVMSGTLSGILRNIAVLITSAFVLYNTNPIMATIGVMIVPLFLIPAKLVGRIKWKLALKSQEKNDEINQILNETLSVSGQMLMKLFTNETKEYEKYKDANHKMTGFKISESLAGRWFMMAMSIYMGIGPMLTYLAGGLLMLKYGNTELTVGDITMMVALLSRMYFPLNSMMSVQVDIVRSLAMFTRIFDYFDMPAEIKEKSDPFSPDQIIGNLELKGVGFSYEEGQKVLSDIDLKIPAGKSVAIVGLSGAGKSTLISLIPRLYDVTEGSIKLDGVDIRDYKISTLRSTIGVVTQDTYLFNDTIRNNLIYANSEATEEALVRACKEANIHDFIISLPDGYDTIVGNRGVKLSGGEKQRVSIARVILKNPSLFIMDEATSSLDSISESLIQNAIEPLLTGRTSIMIAHRLSTIMAADEILVMDGGKIAERGKHNELLVKDGLYRELYETQFRQKSLDLQSNNSVEGA